MNDAFSIDEMIPALVADVKPKYAFNKVMEGKMSLYIWRNTLKQRLRDMLGGFEDDVPDLNIKVIETEAMDGYTREFISFDAAKHFTCPAYILTPNDADETTPVVVAICGHSIGINDIVGIGADGEQYASIEDAGYQKQFALELCRRGFRVIAPEMFNFGFLRYKQHMEIHPNHKSCHLVSMNMRMIGRNVNFYRIIACMRALDVMEQRSGHAKYPIGCMGISSGGLVSTFFAALDERVQAAVISGYAVRFKGGLLEWDKHCPCMYFEDLMSIADGPDILSLIAPRPQLWEIADEDEYFPEFAALEAMEDVKKTYDWFKVPERFEQDRFHGLHVISGEKSYDFLKKWLV